MKIFAFPGQGSQKVGMGADLFPKFPKLIKEANEILSYSIENLCLYDKEQSLSQTTFTQPALFIVNHLSYLNKLELNKEDADCFIGHSLGEFNALLAAGAFSFETGLRLVKKRGELMSKVKGGAMAAILGLEVEKIKTILDKYSLNSIGVANLNSPLQTVISGEREAIINSERFFTENGAKRYIVLPVSGAFHSPYMRSVSEEFYAFARNFSFNHPKKPVFSNEGACPYDKKILEVLTRQIYSPVLWTDLVKNLIFKYGKEVILEEVGPGRVLTGLINKIRQSV